MWPSSSSGDPVPQQQTKSHALTYNFGPVVGLYDAIPMPKSSGASRRSSVALLNETLQRVNNDRAFTQHHIREESRPKYFPTSGHFPHPSVLASPYTTDAWMSKFSKSVERSPNHSPERCVCYVGGMPLLAPQSESTMYELRASSQ